MMVRRFLHVKVKRTIDRLRVEAVTPEALEGWFEQFKGIKSAGNIKAGNIWNMDETGLALGYCKDHLVIGTSNAKYSYVKSQKNRE